MRRLTLAIVILALIGFAAWLILGQQTIDLQPIIVTETVHSIFFAPQYVALHNNYFAQEGLNVQLLLAPQPNMEMETRQIILSSAELAINSRQTGTDSPLIAFASLSQRDGSFLAYQGQDGEFRWENLHGKNILTGPPNLSTLSLEWLLLQEKLCLGSDVFLHHYGANDPASFAFRAGANDILHLWEPHASTFYNSGPDHLLFPLAALDIQLPFSAYHAAAELIIEDPQLLQKFTNAIYRAQIWLDNHNPAEIARLIAPSFPDIDEQILVAAIGRYKQLGVWAKSPLLQPGHLEQLQEILLELGKIGSKYSLEQIVCNTFAQKAVQKIKQE
ncbi:MAG: ABC transporter substrate-binding protein [Firmicutes bacterium]|nr:ABC transporter substrate-binding protein [Bacillota bacterium]